MAEDEVSLVVMHGHVRKFTPIECALIAAIRKTCKLNGYHPHSTYSKWSYSLDDIDIDDIHII